MQAYNANEVMDCYNRTAKEYAEKFLNELDGKPFDRNLLDRFSDILPDGSMIYDFGCGSGQTTKYIHDKRRHRIMGLDFAGDAIQLAKQNFVEIEFVVDEMLHSNMPSRSADGLLAFYAIVHFTYAEVEQALKQWMRLLKPDAICMFIFHVGDDIIEVADFLDVPGAKATWRFLDTDRVLEIAGRVGFKVEEAVIRYPYKEVEHESKRAYVLLRKVGDIQGK
jgi:SAM-dependent methyltransferase